MPVDRATQILIDSKLPRADFDAFVGGGGGGTTYTDEQVRDVIGAALVAGTNIGITVNDAGDTITIDNTAPVSSGTSTTADLGRVAFDSFSGTDDGKLTAALSYAAAQTYTPAIQFTNRLHSFATVNRSAFSGMTLIGPDGLNNPEQGVMSHELHITGAGPWFTNGGATVYGCNFLNLCMTGNSTSSFLGQSGGGQFYSMLCRDIKAKQMKSLLGSQATKLLLTGCTFDGGGWNLNGFYNGMIHVGGSDNTFWPQGGLIDSSTAFYTAGSATNQFHIWMDGMDKSTVGPVYITAEAGWRALRVSGPAWNTVTTGQGGVTITGARIEGRNPTAPCNGSLIRVEGGQATLAFCYINYAMASPPTGDSGIIHHSAGELDVVSCRYDRASGVAETVPFVYTDTTADCMVSRIKRAARGGSWTGRPRVAKPTANAENRVVSDASVTLINV